MELDAVTVLAQPALAVVVEVMAGAVVDNQEDLATLVMAYELPQGIRPTVTI